MSGVELKFVNIDSFVVAFLTLNRPDASNAFNEEVVASIQAAIQQISQKADCRMLILEGKGKHFSAGADLDWMKRSAEMSIAENEKEASALSSLFLSLYECPVPTMAVVQGAAFGGGVGLVAACDWAIADETAKFCLSEVKVGIVSAVILPYLCSKMASGALNRYVMGARVFNSTEAFQCGLVQRVFDSKMREATIEEEVSPICAGSPAAQSCFKKIHRRERGRLDSDTIRQDLIKVIALMRASPSGREGIKAFLEKRAPKWK